MPISQQPFPFLHTASRIIESKGNVCLRSCCVCGGTRPFARKLRNEKLVCTLCGSIGRQRALISLMDHFFPDWESSKIHESSPGGATLPRFARDCVDYIPTHFWPDAPAGSFRDGFRCENLENMTFEDDSFDIVITQDVFEHIYHPQKAFQDVIRTLRPGGAHIFTIPIDGRTLSTTRAREEDGSLTYILPPQYHGNPIDPNGSVVITDWGTDIVEYIHQATGMNTLLCRIRNTKASIEGRHRQDTHSEIFITWKT